jgi:hypothetical protein
MTTYYQICGCGSVFDARINYIYDTVTVTEYFGRLEKVCD